MERDVSSTQFWEYLQTLISQAVLIIDRPKGSPHPTNPGFIYPLDYGYLEGIPSMDGSGLDVWLGSMPEHSLVGIMCTVDLWKQDVEVKLLLGCTPEEIETIESIHNYGHMRAILVPR
jgi:inorganic pyrophosphatase